MTEESNKSLELNSSRNGVGARERDNFFRHSKYLLLILAMNMYVPLFPRMLAVLFVFNICTGCRYIDFLNRAAEIAMFPIIRLENTDERGFMH